MAKSPDRSTPLGQIPTHTMFVARTIEGSLDGEGEPRHREDGDDDRTAVKRRLEELSDEDLRLAKKLKENRLERRELEARLQYAADTSSDNRLDTVLPATSSQLVEENAYRWACRHQTYFEIAQRELQTQSDTPEPTYVQVPRTPTPTQAPSAPLYDGYDDRIETQIVPGRYIATAKTRRVSHRLQLCHQALGPKAFPSIRPAYRNFLYKTETSRKIQDSLLEHYGSVSPICQAP